MQSSAASLDFHSDSSGISLQPRSLQLQHLYQWRSSYGCSYFLGTIDSAEQLNCEATAVVCGAYLSQGELERAGQFVNAFDGQNFRIRRTLLRSILANETESPIEEIKLTTNAFGKPLLIPKDALLQDGAVPTIQFSQSSSFERVFLGIHRDHPIGVDIERHRELPDLTDVAEIVFHSTELRQWLDLPFRHQLAWLYDTWTLKESVLKCVGCGLAIEPKTFVARPSLAFQEIQFIDCDGRHRTVQARNVAALDGYSLAIAIEPAYRD